MIARRWHTAARWAGCALGLAVLASGSAMGAERHWNPEGLWLPEGVSSYSGDIDRLFYGILYLTGAVFVFTEALLIYSVIKFRRQPGRKSVYSHGNHTLELIWTITPALILFGIAIIQKGTWDTIKSDIPKDDVVNVQLFAQQYNWNFRYADPDNKWNTKAAPLPQSTLYVPVNKNIVIEQTSKDVIHSFFIPNMRLKQDVVPGLHIKVWFKALKTTEEMRKGTDLLPAGRPDAVSPSDVPYDVVFNQLNDEQKAVLSKQGKIQADLDMGTFALEASGKKISKVEQWDYEIACAELCGAEHSQMRGVLKVLPQAEYDKTMKQISQDYKDEKIDIDQNGVKKLWKLWKVNADGSPYTVPTAQKSEGEKK